MNKRFFRDGEQVNKAVCIIDEGSITRYGEILHLDEFKEAINNCPNLVIIDNKLWLVQDVKDKSISEIIYTITNAREKYAKT